MLDCRSLGKGVTQLNAPLSVEDKFIPSVKRLAHAKYTHIYHIDPDGRQVTSVFSSVVLQTGLLRERVREKNREEKKDKTQREKSFESRLG